MTGCPLFRFSGCRSAAFFAAALSGIFQLFTVKHPLICFGVPGTVLFVVGLILAFDAISVAANTGEWATTLTLLAGLLLIMGMRLWSVAMILYSLAKIVRGRK